MAPREANEVGVRGTPPLDVEASGVSVGSRVAEWISRADRESSEIWEAKCRVTLQCGGGRGWVSDGGRTRQAFSRLDGKNR